MSAMAQGTAIQALSRGSELLDEPAYLRLARRGIRAFATRPPVGVRATGRNGGSHYLIYSFSGLRVLNAFTQALSGLHRSEEHTSELQSRQYLVCRLLLEKKIQRSQRPP